LLPSTCPPGLNRVVKFLKREVELVLWVLGMRLIRMEKVTCFLLWVLILHVRWVNRDASIGLCGVRRRFIPLWGSHVRDIRISFWPS
jgi:hypothetical protein